MKNAKNNLGFSYIKCVNFLSSTNPEIGRSDIFILHILSDFGAIGSMGPTAGKLKEQLQAMYFF